MTSDHVKRLLIVDDNKEIHTEFYKVLHTEDGETPAGKDQYQIDSAYEGKEALLLVRQSIAQEQPYAVAFVDMEMEPGWDGIETIKHIWHEDPTIQIVIFSDHEDHSWADIAEKLGVSDNLLILKKPFEPIELLQITAALTKKWELIANLNKLIKQRTLALEESSSLNRATLESIREGILVVDHNANIVTYNHIFMEIWELTKEQIDGFSSKEVFQKLAEQVEGSEVFFSLLTNLIVNPKKENIHEWKTRQGKIVELYAQPQILHDDIMGCVFSFRDVSERLELEAQLLHQSTHDSLTGLANRLLLTDRIDQAILHAKRRGNYIGVLAFDLDNFKEINDSFGHNVGDLLLQEVAQRLKTAVRDSDTVTRLGGDEFVVVLVSQTREDDLLVKVSELLKLFVDPFKVADAELAVTSSIGVSIYPKDGQDSETLLKNADIALYRAKEVGRNNYQPFMVEFNEKMLRRAELTTALRQALKNNQFELYYQPLAQLDTLHIIGVEALIRWHHPTLGLVGPDDFIPIAEETGLIIPIGEWVLRTACAQMKAWKNAFKVDFRMAVNISGHQFSQKNFVEMVSNILQEMDINPNCLELEITESILLAKDVDVSKKMMELKDLGVRFSMDDFGTGYASLSYLKYFPFDKLKIDKSFIAGITSDGDDKTIIEAIINMTKAMGIEVMAEGVEKVEQIEFLSEHHMNQVQGFYVSAPVEAKKCEQIILRSLGKDVQ